MKPRARRLFLIGFGALTVLVLCGVWLANSLNRNSAIRATQEWGRLDAFPVPTSDLEVKTSGSMFTREFLITFSGDPQRIQDWVDKSPGTKGLVPVKDANGWWLYKIQPGGGAAAAELRLSPDKSKALVRAAWS